MNDVYRLPSPIIQAVGLACVPLHDLASAAPFARKPVAAAIVTLRQRDDGHVDCIGARVSDAADLQFPVCWLVDQALMPGALTVISHADRATLAAEAMTRRFFVEPQLARILTGKDCIDPAAIMPPTSGEATLCRRLGIPTDTTSDKETERLWTRHAPAPVEQIALARAVSRLMLWANTEAFALAEPGPFFEAILAMRAWMDTQEDEAPTVYGWATSRPVMRAASFASTYHDYRRARADGDCDARWVGFEENLFHC